MQLHALPLIQLNPGKLDPKVIQRISTGYYDQEITTYADAVRDFKYCVVLSLGHEMNGWWYPLGSTVDRNQRRSADFKAAGGMSIISSRAEGATNVIWSCDPSHQYSSWPRGRSGRRRGSGTRVTSTSTGSAWTVTSATTTMATPRPSTRSSAYQLQQHQAVRPGQAGLPGRDRRRPPVGTPAADRELVHRDESNHLWGWCGSMPTPRTTTGSGSYKAVGSASTRRTCRLSKKTPDEPGNDRATPEVAGDWHGHAVAIGYFVALAGVLLVFVPLAASACASAPAATRPRSLPRRPHRNQIAASRCRT